jgi:hypothetical protein
VQNSNSSAVPKGSGSDLSVLFEEIDKMGAFFEAQAPGNLADIPMGMQKEGLGLLYQSFGDKAGSGLPGRFAQGAVQMVDVDG